MYNSAVKLGTAFFEKMFCLAMYKLAVKLGTAFIKGERNQFLICGFTESRTNKKNENMTFFMKIFQGLMLKHVYILLILNFPQNKQAAIFSLSVTSLHPFPFTCSTVSKQ